MLYFDNQAIARPSEAVLRKMVPYLREKWGNPTRYHQMGQELLPDIQEAYQSLYKLVGASSKNPFIFTSSGAEGVSQVILSAYFDITRKSGKNHFVTANTDEAPSILAMSRLQEAGCLFQMIPTNTQGQVTVQALTELLSPRTALVSLSWANGLTGVIQPVEEIAQLCRERGILFHVDATHVLGKGEYTLEGSGADVLTFNGEQLHAPQGTGGLFLREGISLSPLICGGEEQGGMRGGSWNVPGLIGLAQAAEEALSFRDHLCMETGRLRNALEERLCEAIPEVNILFQNEQRLPHITALAFPGITSEALLYVLNRKGLYAHLGGGNFQKMVHLLKACGVEERRALSAVSFALSRETTEEEIDRAVRLITATAIEMRKLSEHIINI